MIDIHGGDGPQGVFERTKSFCGLFWNINWNGGIHNRCILAVRIRHWSYLLAGADDMGY